MTNSGKLQLLKHEKASVNLCYLFAFFKQQFTTINKIYSNLY